MPAAVAASNEPAVASSAAADARRQPALRLARTIPLYQSGTIVVALLPGPARDGALAAALLPGRRAVGLGGAAHRQPLDRQLGPRTAPLRLRRRRRRHGRPRPPDAGAAPVLGAAHAGLAVRASSCSAWCFVCGWTGYVMVWDTFGQRLALEGARMLDALPILSEPIGRAFTGERAVPSAFFFLNLFVHVALPARPRPGALAARVPACPPDAAAAAAAAAGPIVGAPHRGRRGLAPRDGAGGRSLLLPGHGARPTASTPSGCPCRAASRRPPASARAVAAAGARRSCWCRGSAAGERARRPPSEVDEAICTGCSQCVHDCPYDAIRMVERDRRPGRRSWRASIPDLCVSCGICAGSCAPMGVGPTGPDRARPAGGACEHFLAERRTGCRARSSSSPAQHGALAAGDALALAPGRSCIRSTAPATCTPP